MNKPMFSIVLIAKNEATTLPRLFQSLEEFKARGGEVCLLDTGSTDNTTDIAASWGCRVFAVGNKFRISISEEDREAINEKFGNGVPIIQENTTIFDFASARNHVSSLATNDMICTLDADEAYSRFDIDKINQAILDGYDQFEYQFVYAHDHMGRPAVQFVQSKFFDRRKAQWSGIVHEVLSGATKIKYLDPSIILLEHWQEPNKEHRGNYLTGLALDCHQNPNKDRQSHYFARELMYVGRYEAAIKEFKRHITMGGWEAEKAQSMVYIGDCYGYLNLPETQLEWYHKAYLTDSKRRVALLRIASYMNQNNNFHAAAAYAGAALQLPWSDYYANDRAEYEYLPHEILYRAKGFIGDIAGAQEHILKCLEYQPHNNIYLRDTKYYFEYGAPNIEGWMTFQELTWLYHTAKKYKNVLEVGSWKGRSTHALLSGCKGTVTSVDTWEGSIDQRDDTSWMAKREDIFSIFKSNVGHFENLVIHKSMSVEGAKAFPDGHFDMIFIDAGHTYQDVIDDIEAWLPKMKPDGMFCGHDYIESWMGVIAAVDEKFGKPDHVEGSIWSIDLAKRNPKPKETIPNVIYTCWFNEDGIIPEDIQKCIDSQKIPGYKHRLITLENVINSQDPYIKQCLASTHGNKKWVKLTDYLRMNILNVSGGIFLDADVEIIEGKNFNHLLENKMFVGNEGNTEIGSVIGTAIIGAVKQHPLIEDWIDRVTTNFRGDDDLCYESSMDILNKILLVEQKYTDSVKIVDPEVLYPYNHIKKETHITHRSITIHHFNKTWVNNELPTVTILLPQLGREDTGLTACLESIKALKYPQDKIDLQIIDGDDTVPVKIADGLANAKGEYICYAANDMVFTPDSLFIAVVESIDNNKALVAFNSGIVGLDEGNICEHFIIRKDFIPLLENGQIFSTDFYHVGVDNWLWLQADVLGQAYRSEKAVVIHNHFSTTGAEIDEVYRKGWRNVEEDRKTLARKIENLHNNTIFAQ